MLSEIGDERGSIGLAAAAVAQCVQLKYAGFQHAQTFKDVSPQRDHFGVGLWLCWPHQFHADLVKLAIAPLLWPLVPEHGAGIEEFKRG